MSGSAAWKFRLGEGGSAFVVAGPAAFREAQGEPAGFPKLGMCTLWLCGVHSLPCSMAFFVVVGAFFPFLKAEFASNGKQNAKGSYNAIPPLFPCQH